jgi:hypothetical protein
MTRELGVRLLGGVSIFSTESDDGKVSMQSAQPSHGQNVGRPGYCLLDAHGETSLGTIPGDGNEFGFWPGSHAALVLGSRTWFFDAKGHYQGWVAGKRVGNAADRKGMIFRLEEERSVTVSPDLKAVQPQRFVLPDGTALFPLELHPDIGLGLFALPKLPEEPQTTDEKAEATIKALDDVAEILRKSRSVVLARWNAEMPKKTR